MRWTTSRRCLRAKEDEMDAELCSESCHNSDVDDSEFPGCGVVLRILITLLSF